MGLDAAWANVGMGKVSSGVFENVIQPSLGRVRPEVLVGPQAGVDTGILDVGAGQVLAVTCDPLFVVPEFGWERAAWFAIHIVASDAATSGLAPMFCTLDLNLPPLMTDADLASLWEAIHETCTGIDVAIVSGHTGRYDDCSYPMLGGCTMMGLGGNDRYVTSAMARVGDAVLVTKGAAIETVGQLGVLFEDRVSRTLGARIARAASDLFFHMTVVKDAGVAADFGVRDEGVTAMHDATERGVWGALVEMAEAAGTGLIVHRGAVPILEEVAAVCDLFGVDPYTSSSEGTLVLTCGPKHALSLIDRFESEGIRAQQIGELTPPHEGVRLVIDGRECPLHMPAFDPFWSAVTRARAEDSA